MVRIRYVNQNFYWQPYGVSEFSRLDSWLLISVIAWSSSRYTIQRYSSTVVLINYVFGQALSTTWSLFKIPVWILQFNFGKEFVKGRWRPRLLEIFSGAKTMSRKFRYFVLKGQKVNLLNVSVYLNKYTDIAMLSKITRRDLYLAHAYLCFLIKFATAVLILPAACKRLSRSHLSILKFQQNEAVVNGNCNVIWTKLCKTTNPIQHSNAHGNVRRRRQTKEL